MSIYVDALRDRPSQLTCDLAADEIEDMEKAYALLFEENAKLRAELAALLLPAQAPAVPPESLQEGIPQKPVGKFIFRDGHWQQVYLSNPEGQLLYACPVGSASTSEPAQAVQEGGKHG